MVTPFNNDKSVDWNSLDKITNHLISNGVDYLVVMGTTGENPTLSPEEQYKILDRVKLVNNGTLPIVFGIGGNNTHAILQKFKEVNFDGVDAILSVSPYYNKPNAAGIYQHYRVLSDAAPKPIIMYNVPGRTGSCVSAESTLKIAELENVIATKEASGSFEIIMEIIRNKPNDFMVISGDDNYTFPYISLGMDGVISVIGNAYPKQFSNMVNLCLNGEIEKARALHYQLLPMINAIFMDGNPGGVKYLMSKMDLCKNEFRLPVVEVNKQTKVAIDAAEL